MDQRVEKLESDVSSLMTGQLQILEKINELFGKLNSKNSLLEVNMEREEGEHSNAPPHDQGRSGNTMGSRQISTHHSYVPRMIKLDFPRYNGSEDTTSWVCRVEQFFHLHQTPEEERVALASFHLEGDAQQWFQLIKQERDMLTWQEFCDSLHARYGATQFQDFFGELIKLQQVGSVCDYQTQFKKLLAKVGQLSQDRQVSCFVSGLKDTIKADVPDGRPNTLTSAIRLTRLYEARNISQRRSTTTTEVKKNNSVKKELTFANSTLPVRRLAPVEMQEKRIKGLCYNCDEKFTPRHRCKKLFLIEACYDGDNDVVMDEDEAIIEDSKVVPEISLHVISGVKALSTMQVEETIGSLTTIVLVDSGSTHNFISEDIARKLGLQPKVEEQFKVVVASGERLPSCGKCTNVTLLLQGIFSISIDFYILPLKGYDIVLGTQWLRTLGQIMWDFAKLQMSFIIANKEIVLRGESIADDKLVGEVEVNREVRKCKKGMVLQLSSVQNITMMNQHSPSLQKHLEEFDDVFGEPKGLPLSRNHDHKIPLKLGSEPVCVKPYCYPHFQKTEIEKIVANLLSTGVIKSNNSPYSSPVILVKKHDGSWRMCVDYRALNKITINDKFPILVIDELLDELNGATIFFEAGLTKWLSSNLGSIK
ncbi:hypothetical protein KPL70_002068 [Citrus sinensis]|nr:hypothetical protein KPL70_002068 [Citrus sinensis]